MPPISCLLLFAALLLRSSAADVSNFATASRSRTFGSACHRHFERMAACSRRDNGRRSMSISSAFATSIPESLLLDRRDSRRRRYDYRRTDRNLRDEVKVIGSTATNWGRLPYLKPGSTFSSDRDRARQRGQVRAASFGESGEKTFSGLKTPAFVLLGVGTNLNGLKFPANNCGTRGCQPAADGCRRRSSRRWPVAR